MAKAKTVHSSFVVSGVDTHKDLHVAAVVDQNNRIFGQQILFHNPSGVPGYLHPLDYPFAFYLTIASKKSPLMLRGWTWHSVTGSCVPKADIN